MTTQTAVLSKMATKTIDTFFCTCTTNSSTNADKQNSTIPKSVSFWWFVVSIFHHDWTW